MKPPNFGPHLLIAPEDGLHHSGVAGGKINGAWMSGFTVPGDKRHMHFAHHKMETLLICIITACKECSLKLFISNKKSALIVLCFMYMSFCF